jgi:DNA-binding XRE family transcriptional regulator
MKHKELIKARRRNGYMQKEVAQIVGISLRAYQKYENEGQVPNTRTAIRIARVLGSTVESLWGGNPE